MKTRWIRTCQECDHEQEDTPPDTQKDLTDAYRNRKCENCQSSGLDYGTYKDLYANGEYEPEGRSEDLIDGVGFADPGGNSALRAATKSNPRNLPCPNCGKPNRLTPIDRAHGYQCDECADQLERGGY